MRKKTALILVFIFFLTFALQARGEVLEPVFSARYNRAYEDYLFTFNLYRRHREDYLLAKEKYKTYKTLVSKNELIEKTRIFLSTSGEVLITYLSMLKIKVEEQEGFEAEEQEAIFAKIESELALQRYFKNELNTLSTLESGEIFSQTLDKHYKDTQVLAKQILGKILVAKTNFLALSAGQEILKLEEEIRKLESGGAETKTFATWLSDIKAMLDTTFENKTSANLELSEFEDIYEAKTKYKKATSFLEKANDNLSLVLANLLELTGKLKNI